MAFGDYLNDYTLLQSCGESYAMANAHPDLKAIAKYVTASNDEDGVMKILRTLWPAASAVPYRKMYYNRRNTPQYLLFFR